MNRSWPLLLAVAVAGCNDGDVTKNGTVPPIAGIVGGPDQTGGSGQVAVEIRADSASVVGGTNILVQNESHTVDEAVAEVPLEGAEFVTLKIGGDVGDELRVYVTHPEEGEIDRLFEVTRPKITEVRDPEGPEPVIHAGFAAQITGSGFCVAPACNTVIFDGTTLLATVEEPRPGLVYFTVPGGAVPGTHTVRVAVAGTEGGTSDYVSTSFEVTLAP